MDAAPGGGMGFRRGLGLILFGMVLEMSSVALAVTDIAMGAS